MRLRAGRVIAAGALLLLLIPGPSLAADPPPGTARTPIQHAVFVMMENHSFANLFGTFGTANGVPVDACVPRDPTQPGAGCVQPTWVGDRTVTSFAQSTAIFDLQYNAGKLDGFFRAQSGAGVQAPFVMGYYDDREIPFLWNVADAYVLFDNFFSSAKGGSLPNHLYWVAGTAGSTPDALPSAGYGDLLTIFDRLQAAGVDWKFYVQNYDPTVTLRNPQRLIEQGSQVERVPLLAFPRFIDNPLLFSHIVDLSQYFRDLGQGTLPAVSYIVPAGGGAHTPASIRNGDQLSGSLINALTRSSSWSSSMLLLTYASSGGWFDNVKPPQVDAGGFGFRVPALLVGPYARKGYVDGTQLDHTSMVRFITDNWGLQPLASRDANSLPFVSAFDFVNPGRPAVLLSTTRAGSGTQRTPNRAIIFIAYGTALAAAISLVAIAAFRSRRSGKRDHATRIVK